MEKDTAGRGDGALPERHRSWWPSPATLTVVPCTFGFYGPDVRTLAEDLVRLCQAEQLSAVALLKNDFDACIVNLESLVAHRKTIRTTNVLERLFLEERRRTRIIPHAFGENDEGH